MSSNYTSPYNKSKNIRDNQQRLPQRKPRQLYTRSIRNNNNNNNTSTNSIQEYTSINNSNSNHSSSKNQIQFKAKDAEDVIDWIDDLKQRYQNLKFEHSKEINSLKQQQKLEIENLKNKKILQRKHFDEEFNKLGDYLKEKEQNESRLIEERKIENLRRQQEYENIENNDQRAHIGGKRLPKYNVQYDDDEEEEDLDSEDEEEEEEEEVEEDEEVEDGEENADNNQYIIPNRQNYQYPSGLSYNNYPSQYEDKGQNEDEAIEILSGSEEEEDIEQQYDEEEESEDVEQAYDEEDEAITNNVFDQQNLNYLNQNYMQPLTNNSHQHHHHQQHINYTKIDPYRNGYGFIQNEAEEDWDEEDEEMDHDEEVDEAEEEAEEELINEEIIETNTEIVNLPVDASDNDNSEDSVDIEAEDLALDSYDEFEEEPDSEDKKFIVDDNEDKNESFDPNLVTTENVDEDVNDDLFYENQDHNQQIEINHVSSDAESWSGVESESNDEGNVKAISEDDVEEISSDLSETDENDVEAISSPELSEKPLNFDSQVDDYADEEKEDDTDERPKPSTHTFNTLMQYASSALGERNIHNFKGTHSQSGYMADSEITDNNLAKYSSIKEEEDEEELNSNSESDSNFNENNFRPEDFAPLPDAFYAHELSDQKIKINDLDDNRSDASLADESQFESMKSDYHHTNIRDIHSSNVENDPIVIEEDSEELKDDIKNDSAQEVEVTEESNIAESADEEPPMPIFRTIQEEDPEVTLQKLKETEIKYNVKIEAVEDLERSIRGSSEAPNDLSSQVVEEVLEPIQVPVLDSLGSESDEVTINEETTSIQSVEEELNDAEVEEGTDTSTENQVKSSPIQEVADETTILSSDTDVVDHIDEVFQNEEVYDVESLSENVDEDGDTEMEVTEPQEFASSSNIEVDTMEITPPELDTLNEVTYPELDTLNDITPMTNTAEDTSNMEVDDTKPVSVGNETTQTHDILEETEHASLPENVSPSSGTNEEDPHDVESVDNTTVEETLEVEEVTPPELDAIDESELIIDASEVDRISNNSIEEISNTSESQPGTTETFNLHKKLLNIFPNVGIFKHQLEPFVESSKEKITSVEKSVSDATNSLIDSAEQFVENINDADQFPVDDQMEDAEPIVESQVEEKFEKLKDISTQVADYVVDKSHELATISSDLMEVTKNQLEEGLSNVHDKLCETKEQTKNEFSEIVEDVKDSGSKNLDAAESFVEKLEIPERAKDAAIDVDEKVRNFAKQADDKLKEVDFEKSVEQTKESVSEIVEAAEEFVSEESKAEISHNELDVDQKVKDVVEDSIERVKDIEVASLINVAKEKGSTIIEAAEEFVDKMDAFDDNETEAIDVDEKIKDKAEVVLDEIKEIDVSGIIDETKDTGEKIAEAVNDFAERFNPDNSSDVEGIDVDGKVKELAESVVERVKDIDVSSHLEESKEIGTNVLEAAEEFVIKMDASMEPTVQGIDVDKKLIEKSKNAFDHLRKINVSDLLNVAKEKISVFNNAAEDFVEKMDAIDSSDGEAIDVDSKVKELVEHKIEQIEQIDFTSAIDEAKERGSKILEAAEGFVEEIDADGKYNEEEEEKTVDVDKKVEEIAEDVLEKLQEVDYSKLTENAVESGTKVINAAEKFVEKIDPTVETEEPTVDVDSKIIEATKHASDAIKDEATSLAEEAQVLGSEIYHTAEKFVEQDVEYESNPDDEIDVDKRVTIAVQDKVHDFEDKVSNTVDVVKESVPSFLHKVENKSKELVDNSISIYKNVIQNRVSSMKDYIKENKIPISNVFQLSKFKQFVSNKTPHISFNFSHQTNAERDQTDSDESDDDDDYTTITTEISYTRPSKRRRRKRRMLRSGIEKSEIVSFEEITVDKIDEPIEQVNEDDHESPETQEDSLVVKEEEVVLESLNTEVDSPEYEKIDDLNEKVKTEVEDIKQNTLEIRPKSEDLSTETSNSSKKRKRTNRRNVLGLDLDEIAQFESRSLRNGHKYGSIDQKLSSRPNYNKHNNLSNESIPILDDKDYPATRTRSKSPMKRLLDDESNGENEDSSPIRKIRKISDSIAPAYRTDEDRGRSREK
ncbi:uncharacterized protein KGF55_000119 [Candida pseudojiufengensis]|uniref:uncharacterized protein n=1 Tax=Candida pseudojiufengensis TaxID=497109 RepID=UPI002225632F|nr:uncharacterized protein KGF55_000119 [Candida pseudojiufengensis]KAI5966710.1 hypothetical protein KGF55_000119 [Candida pseudojiufengensis]